MRHRRTPAQKAGDRALDDSIRKVVAYVMAFERLGDGNHFAYVEGLPGCDAIGFTMMDAAELCYARLRRAIDRAVADGLPLPVPEHRENTQ